MVEPPAPHEKGRSHKTGEGRTEASRVVRSGSDGEPGRLDRAPRPGLDPTDAMIRGIDAPKKLDAPEDLDEG